MQMMICMIVGQAIVGLAMKYPVSSLSNNKDTVLMLETCMLLSPVTAKV